MSASKTITLTHGTGSATHAIIWLHGLGASSNDFPPVVPYLGLSASPTIRFIFPQAPNRPITVNNGMVMPGWYDIKGINIADKEDLPGMRESQLTLNALIEDCVADGIPSEHVIVAGFSQGGAVAYYTGIRSPHKLAGILALSAYLPFASVADAEHSGVNVYTPIMAMHGLHDGVVPLSIGKLSADTLITLGYPVQWQTYPMQHSVVPEQLEDIGAWIKEVFQA